MSDGQFQWISRRLNEFTKKNQNFGRIEKFFGF